MSQISVGIDDLERRVGRTTRRWRIEAGLSQEELAERASLSRTAVQALERGTGTRLVTLLRVLRAIDREDALDALTSEPAPSPIELLALQRRAERETVDAPRAPRDRR